jgi:hypothetical protein
MLDASVIDTNVLWVDADAPCCTTGAVTTTGTTWTAGLRTT